MNEAILRAAAQRAPRTDSTTAYESRNDRPRDRRNAESGGKGRSGLMRIAPTVVRAAVDGTGALRFAGCASATGQGYEMWDWAGAYTEFVDPGAFGKSLARADLDVPLVIEHVPGRRLARTTIPAGELGHLALTETADGLMCAADLDPADPDVAYIAPKLASGLIDEMSFRFMITRGEWSPDYMQYNIQEVDIHRGDVAICAYGANPNTTAGLREPSVQLDFVGGEAELRALIRDIVRAGNGNGNIATALGRPAFLVLNSDLT